jgi:hypothetical protein
MALLGGGWRRATVTSSSRVDGLRIEAKRCGRPGPSPEAGRGLLEPSTTPTAPAADRAGRSPYQEFMSSAVANRSAATTGRRTRRAAALPARHRGSAGLRGAAVVLYHAHPLGVRGGFVGVDAFFVISVLITRSPSA